MSRNKPSPIDLSAIAAAVAPLVAELLARALTTGVTTPYSTRKGCGPPGLGHRAWQKLAPTIPGAQHLGRWVVVPRAAFDVWTSRGATAAPPPPENEPWTSAKAFASVGLRPTK